MVSHAKAINVTTGDKTSEIRESRGVISHVGCEHRCTDEGGSALSAESKGGGVGFWGVKFFGFSNANSRPDWDSNPTNIRLFF